jgi:hypothetical protein
MTHRNTSKKKVRNHSRREKATQWLTGNPTLIAAIARGVTTGLCDFVAGLWR